MIIPVVSIAILPVETFVSTYYIKNIYTVIPIFYTGIYIYAVVFCPHENERNDSNLPFWAGARPRHRMQKNPHNGIHNKAPGTNTGITMSSWYQVPGTDIPVSVPDGVHFCIVSF